MRARGLNLKCQSWFSALLLFLPSSSARSATDATLPLLTNAAQLRRLTPAEARRELPARVRGVATFYHKAQNELFLQDDTGGVLVRVGDHFGFEMGVGQLLEAEGTAQPGVPCAELRASEVRLVGEGPLPPVCQVTRNQLEAGEPDGSWVEVKGIAHVVEIGRADGLLGLEVDTAAGPLVALIKDYNLEECRSLTDAEVVVCGVMRRTPAGQTGLRVPAMGDIAITAPAARDPFEAPQFGFLEMRRALSGKRPAHRIKMSGVVTFQQAGRAVFIQDTTNALLVLTEQRTQLSLGEVIEATGFPGLGSASLPTLEHAAFRKIGKATVPKPAAISAEEGSMREGILVTIEGLVSSCEEVPAPKLKLRSGKTLFSARLEGGARGLSAPVREGNRVRVTGICRSLSEARAGESVFELWLRSPADLELVAASGRSRLVWLIPAVAAGILALVAFRRSRNTPHGKGPSCRLADLG